MVSFGSKEQGVSLIELMVTITILSILVLAGTSLTGLWSKQAELDKATMSLKSAMSLGRSTAIRNQSGQKMDDIVSQICFGNNKLSVHKAPKPTEPATGPASCSSPIVFSYPLSSTIEIKDTNGTRFKCFAFNNFGQVINVDTANCKSNLSLIIGNGSLNEKLTLN